jgi:small conductance mechanosensitive channel
VPRSTTGPATRTWHTGATWLIGKPLAIAVIIIAAVLARWLGSKAIDRVVSRAETASVPGGRGAYNRRAQRAKSLGTLLKSITTTVVFGIAFVMVLSEVGIDVAPILASAGVLGLAIGFGAQNLVKDFLSGVMMMVEDQYGVGDAVDLARQSATWRPSDCASPACATSTERSGTCATARSCGSATRARTGPARSWTSDVGYREDLVRVRDVLQDVAHGLWEDEDYKDVIIEEPEVWGVENLSPDAVVMRVTLKTAPMEQWQVAREMRSRIKARFDYEGIEIPLPQRVVWHREQTSAQAGDPTGGHAGSTTGDTGNACVADSTTPGD